MVVLPIFEFKFQENDIVSENEKIVLHSCLIFLILQVFYDQNWKLYYLKKAMSLVALMYSLTIGMKRGGWDRFN